jgi:hypothetical protein
MSSARRSSSSAGTFGAQQRRQLAHRQKIARLHAEGVIEVKHRAFAVALKQGRLRPPPPAQRPVWIERHDAVEQSRRLRCLCAFHQAFRASHQQVGGGRAGMPP